ncbi:MAG: hypothetical protein KF746_12790 [Chitinophagaceae bacterium]|nr:hypothetical protein [Chitinophagaceae bacterium]
MRKTLLLFLYIAFSFCGYTQQSDFISLKKKNGRTVKSYFKGVPFEFVHSNGSAVSGIIDRVYNDTVFMILYDVRMSPTFWGTRAPDTIAKYDLRFHYKEIAAIPKPAKGFEFVRNGTLFMIGGGGYAFLHTFNGLIQKKEISPPVIAISGGVALLGFGMKKLRKYYYFIGKRHTIEYVKMTS